MAYMGDKKALIRDLSDDVKTLLDKKTAHNLMILGRKLREYDVFLEIWQSEGNLLEICFLIYDDNDNPDKQDNFDTGYYWYEISCYSAVPFILPGKAARKLERLAVQWITERSKGEVVERLMSRVAKQHNLEK